MKFYSASKIQLISHSLKKLKRDEIKYDTFPKRLTTFMNQEGFGFCFFDAISDAFKRFLSTISMFTFQKQTQDMIKNLI